MPKPVQPELLIAVSPMQAAACTGLSPAIIYEALRTGQLVAYKISAKRRILVRDLIAFIESFPAPKSKTKKATATEETEQ